MDKIATCLWYDGEAEAAASFYTSLLPDSRIDATIRSPADTPSGKTGEVLVVHFTLAGRSYMGLNGGPMFKHSEAASIHVLCDDQAEIDRLWKAFIDNGGTESQCGWLSDRWGVPWQIVPKRMYELIQGDDRGRAGRAVEAMMKMVKFDIAELDRAANG